MSSSAVSLTYKDSPVYLADYKPYTGIRCLVIASIATAIILSLALTGQFSHFYHWVTQAALWKPVTCAAVGFTLLIGAALIIYRAKQGLAQGKNVGRDHWKKCTVKMSHGTSDYAHHFTQSAHLDLSRLDEKGSGVARVYFKSKTDATITAAVSLIALPIYVLVVMGYNLLRMVAIPVYIAVQMVRERNLPNGLYPDQGKFSIGDIFKHMSISMENVVQAPCAGSAMYFASLYTLLDPMNGIKLGSAIEDYWNDHVPMRNSGVWLVKYQPFKDWRWEGGGGPKKLGQNAVYFAGSWLPWIELKCEAWKIVGITGIEGGELDEDWNKYELLSRQCAHLFPKELVIEYFPITAADH